MPSASYAQDVLRWKCIDDSLLGELPTNTQTFSLSDGEVELVKGQTQLSEENDDEIVNFLSGLVQEVCQ